MSIVMTLEVLRYAGAYMSFETLFARRSCVMLLLDEGYAKSIVKPLLCKCCKMANFVVLLLQEAAIMLPVEDDRQIAEKEQLNEKTMQLQESLQTEKNLLLLVISRGSSMHPQYTSY